MPKKEKKIVMKKPPQPEAAKESAKKVAAQATEEIAEVIDTPPKEDKYAEMLDKYQRCLAEFDNFRKRTTKEMFERHSDGIRAACEKFLPIVDNFARALSSADDKENNFYKGIEMIARQFDSVLDELGVKSIEIPPESTFDPVIHHAVAHIEDEKLPENTITEVLQKGYMHKEKVIRPAMVIVAN